MKVTLTKQDVQQIVLSHMARNFPTVDLNTVEFGSEYSSYSGFCTVTYEKPKAQTEQEAPESETA